MPDWLVTVIVAFASVIVVAAVVGTKLGLDVQPVTFAPLYAM